MEPQTRGHSFLGLFIQRKTWKNRQLLDVVVLRVLRRQSSAYYATQPTNRVSAFGDSDISCRSIHVCVYRKEQTRATDRAAVASVWRSLPGVMVPCGCLCIVLSSYCQLFTGDNIPSGNENLASLARPYFRTVWFTRLLGGFTAHAHVKTAALLLSQFFIAKRNPPSLLANHYTSGWVDLKRAV